MIDDVAVEIITSLQKRRRESAAGVLVMEERQTIEKLSLVVGLQLGSKQTKGFRHCIYELKMLFNSAT